VCALIVCSFPLIDRSQPEDFLSSKFHREIETGSPKNSASREVLALSMEVGASVKYRGDYVFPQFNKRKWKLSLESWKENILNRAQLL